VDVRNRHDLLQVNNDVARRVVAEEKDSLGSKSSALGGGRCPATPFKQPFRPDCAAHDGFSLQAGVCVIGTERCDQRSRRTRVDSVARMGEVTPG
jgi:hypothetical protein